MKKEWKPILLGMLKDGSIPTEATLNDSAITTWSLDSEVIDLTQLMPEATSTTLSTLGDKAADVPLEVHTAMVQLSVDKMIPMTTLAQRNRNRPTHQTTYRVPPELADALKYGYVSPMLPAPSGTRWVGVNGAWMLQLLGG